ncbi:FOLR1 protein, partial [Probosciger aterrimus]|nr:FOLR1 protein [Probosciger aterrimus]
VRMGLVMLLLSAACTVVPARDSLLNVCMDAKHHKTKPGPEGLLYEQCAPWKDNACCTANTSQEAHQDQSYLYSFNWNHCGVMPPKCKRQGLEQAALVEGVPALGRGWSWKSFKVPFNPNQAVGERTKAKGPCSCGCFLLWCCLSSGTNRCPWGSMCRPFSQVFPRPKDLCEKIWSNSYRYTTEQRGSGRCIQMWFDPAQGNPNVVVAKYYAWKKRSSAWMETEAPKISGAEGALPWPILVLLPLAIMVLLDGAGGFG